MPLFVGARSYEVLQFHVLEFPNPKNEVARRDFIAKGLADLRDAEWHCAGSRVQHVFEVGEDVLRRFRAQIGEVPTSLNWSDVRFEHQIERPRSCKLSRSAMRALTVDDVVRPTSFSYMSGNQRAGP